MRIQKQNTESTENIDNDVFRAFINKCHCDIPEAIEWDMMEKIIATLKNFKSFDSPLYDFKTKLQNEDPEKVIPHECILLVGALLTMKRIRKNINLKIYIETDNDVKLSRRVK